MRVLSSGYSEHFSLEELKQAIIHRAVTRGLDPNACLKSSGVPGHAAPRHSCKSPLVARPRNPSFEARERPV